MKFNEETFCPYIKDKSTPIRKFLLCTKTNSLCSMVQYYPTGEMIPKVNVKEVGCIYGDKKEEKTTKGTRKIQGLATDKALIDEDEMQKIVQEVLEEIREPIKESVNIIEESQDAIVENNDQEEKQEKAFEEKKEIKNISKKKKKKNYTKRNDS